jgi:hypothetical protein
MNLWIDTTTPIAGYKGCSCLEEAKQYLDKNIVINISIGDDIRSAQYIERQADLGLLKPIKWKNHTNNLKIQSALKRADMYWSMQ